MKKNGIFKILCLVLAVALLSPHVFAATPAPEAPLADAATVARVKQEIADGQITDMEDVFLVAYQHLGADINEDGMTVYINEDGTLGITQIICSGKNTTRSGSVEKTEYAVSTLALLSVSGGEATVTGYSPYADTDHHPVNGTNLVILHTAYYNGDGEVTPLDPPPKIQIRNMVTTITGSGAPYYVTKLVQKYEFLEHGQPMEQDSKTTTGTLSGSYTFTPSVRSWHNTYTVEAKCIRTSADVYISGIATPVHLETVAELCETIPPSPDGW